MWRNASPIAWVPVAQAVVTPMEIPLAPVSMEIFPAIIFGTVMVTMSGDTLETPRSMAFFVSRSSVMIPPMPVPPMTPRR